MTYTEYMASSAWRNNAARRKALSFAEGRCRICHHKAPLEVHHATYERMGCENDNDLVAICGPCHIEVTAFLRRRRYQSRVPKRADVMPLRDMRIITFDPTTGSV